MNREMLINKGLAKYDMFFNERRTFIVRSLLGGLYLGLAVIFSYTLGALLTYYYTPIVGKMGIAFTFGIGLVAIYLLGAELFTGNCFSGILSCFAKKSSLMDYFKMLFVCYAGNFVGIFIICGLFVLSGVNMSYIEPYFEDLMATKAAIPIMELFIRGILANFVVCMGSLAAALIKTESAKIITIMLLVAAFVLPGFEHSIANMGIFTIGYGIGYSNFAIIPLHMLLSTMGNIIGGALLFALPVYLMTKVDEFH